MLSVALIACRMHLCVMTHASCVPLVIPRTRWGLRRPKWSTPGGHAEGTGTGGGIRWAPCVCDDAARTSDQHSMRAEETGTNGAIRLAPCGRD